MSLAAQHHAFCAANPITCRQLLGVRWEYIACGRGAACLLLLPGAMGLADTSFEYALAFAPHMRVLTVSYPPAVPTVAGLADGLAALLVAEGVGQAHLLGGSYSGMVAQVLARRHPGLIASLLLATTGLPQPARVVPLTLILALVALLPQERLRALLRCGLSHYLPDAGTTQDFWRGYLRAAIAGTSKAHLLAKLLVQIDFDARWSTAALGWHGPVLLLDAPGDALFGPADQRALRRLYPQAQTHTLAGRGHSAALDGAPETIAAIKRFLWPT